MKNLQLPLALLLLAISSISEAKCGEITPIRPLDSIVSQTNAPLYARDFKRLDKLADEYQSPDALSIDGQPKLMGFYAALSRSNLGCREDKGPDAEWETHRRLLREWSQASPQLLAPRIALAELENSFAWKARGDGYASSVTEQGWKLFRERAKKSRDMLEALKPQAQSDPGWYAAMLNVAVSQGWDPQLFEQTYKEATRKFPHYLEFYFVKALFYSSKWYGTPAQFQAFVEETVAATEKRMGQTMYARINWSAQSSEMFRNGQTDWPRMKQGFERMIADFPDMWNLNNFASFACMARDLKTTQELLPRIKGNVIQQAWITPRRYGFCVEWAEGKR